MSEGVYLLVDREFRESQQNVYKIGREKSNCVDTFEANPCDFIFFICVEDSLSVENAMKSRFKELFKWRSDIGLEYFEGDQNAMITEIFSIAKTSQLPTGQTTVVFENPPMEVSDTVTSTKHEYSQNLTCVCGYTCNGKFCMDRHRKSPQHERNMSAMQFQMNDSRMYECKTCHFSTKFLGNYRRHVNTSKHEIAISKVVAQQVQNDIKSIVIVKHK